MSSLEPVTKSQPEGVCYSSIIQVSQESGEDPVLGATRGLWLYKKLKELEKYSLREVAFNRVLLSI